MHDELFETIIGHRTSASRAVCISTATQMRAVLFGHQQPIRPRQSSDMDMDDIYIEIMLKRLCVVGIHLDREVYLMGVRSCHLPRSLHFFAFLCI